MKTDITAWLLFWLVPGLRWISEGLQQKNKQQLQIHKWLCLLSAVQQGVRDRNKAVGPTL